LEKNFSTMQTKMQTTALYNAAAAASGAIGHPPGAGMASP